MSERYPELARLAAPGLLLVGFLWPTLTFQKLAPALEGLLPNPQRWVYPMLAAGAWAAGAWLASRVLEALFWDRVVGRRLGAPVPSLVKSVSSIVLFLMAAGGFVGITLGYSVTGLWATSGVIGIIIGLALQSMIADVFSGLAINVDRPFTIGDWIRVQPRGSDPLIGRVEEVSWRATRLCSIDNVMHILPNNLLGVLAVTNLSRPQSRSRFALTFRVDHSVAHERVLRILEAAVRDAGVLEDPPPQVRIDDVSENGVVYCVYFWLEPVEISPRRGRHQVAASVLKHLSAAGIALAHPKRDLSVTPPRVVELDLDRDQAALVRRVSLFSGLEDDEVERLAASVTRRRFESGQVVFEKDDPGDSMFLVVEGLLAVLVPVEGRSEPLRVGHLGGGDFFGEMSLLTGEPRSATVCAVTDALVFEIEKPHVQELITDRPEVVRQLSRVVAERQAANLAALDRTDDDGRAPEATGLADRLFERITRFFGAGRGDA